VVGKDFMADLEAVRDALSHKFPDRDLAEVLHECLKVTLEVVRKRREGTGRAPTREPKEGTRHVPTALRRQVFERDGRRCAYVHGDGTRCNSTYQVELHHLEPFATGGPATLDNLELRCHPHNQLHARQELGDRYIDQAIARSRTRGFGETSSEQSALRGLLPPERAHEPRSGPTSRGSSV
jgi:5-methylcytosine-specific restriction endonuclease McrA